MGAANCTTNGRLIAIHAGLDVLRQARSTAVQSLARLRGVGYNALALAVGIISGLALLSSPLAET